MQQSASHASVTPETYDVAVIGGGIVGLAHAYAAARAGARVVVLDRSTRQIGASIRNFGFVTVTGQERHDMWPFARRSREIWANVAPQAGIAIEQTGLMMLARRAASIPVLEEFLATEMGEGCELLSAGELAQRCPNVPFAPVEAALHSPHDLRIEATAAIPALTTWLGEAQGVEFRLGSAVLHVEPGLVTMGAGSVRAKTIFVCPGDHLASLYPDLAQEMGVSRSKLQMMRLADPGYRLPHPIMSDLGLTRYEGYSALSSAPALGEAIRADQGALLDAGIHLIVTQSADGSLVVGDSHDYGAAPDPFQHEHIDAMILSEFANVLGTPPPVINRWVGVYAWSPQRNWFTREYQPGVHVSVVTSGAGMSSAFAIGEHVVASALHTQLPELN